MSEPIFERIEEYALSKKDRPKSQFEKIGIVGCGSKGQSLSIMVASKGFEVVFIELNQQHIDRAFAEIEAELQTRVNRWEITAGEKRGILSRIHGSLDYNELKTCDIVLEAILSIEKEDKKEVFRKIEEFVSPTAIIVANSTEAIITETAKVLQHKNRFVGAHFSNLIPDGNLVEIVGSLYTTDEVFENLQKFVTLLGKKYIKVAESAGLVSLRLFAPIINEACCILSEKIVELEDIDFAAKSNINIHWGPFEMADKIGIDNVVRWLDDMYAEFGDLKYKPSPVLKRLVRAEKLGKKSGQGFYTYDKKGEIIKS